VNVDQIATATDQEKEILKLLQLMLKIVIIEMREGNTNSQLDDKLYTILQEVVAAFMPDLPVGERQLDSFEFLARLQASFQYPSTATLNRNKSMYPQTLTHFITTNTPGALKYVHIDDPEAQLTINIPVTECDKSKANKPLYLSELLSDNN